MPPAPARSAPHPAPATRPARRRRLAPEERLPQILEAALAEFAERGYAGASMAAAAARAGIAKGLIYHYVPGKAELFRAVVRSCLQPAFAEAEGLIAGFQGGNRTALLERLIELAYARVARERRERILFKLLLVEAERFPELAELYRTEVLARAVGLIRGILEAGEAAGEFRPGAAAEGLPEVLMAPAIMASIWQMMLGEAAAPRPEAMCRAHVALALQGLAAKKGAT